MRLDRPRLVVSAACLLVVAACGRFADADRTSEEIDVGAPATVPDDVEGPADVATTSAPRPAEAAPEPRAGVDAPERTAGSGVPRGQAANAASATTDGLEVEVVAEGGPDYGSHPRFRIQVTLRNRSDRTRYYFLGQGNFAALTDQAGTVAWTSGACNPTLGVYEISGGAAPLEPGAEVPVIVPYPAPDSGVDADCELPDGRYTLYGLFPVCPDETVEETANPGTYACPEDAVRQHSSAGLPITIGGG